MAGMIFLSKNYISADDTINVSSGDIYKSRLYDQKHALQWISSGETSETGYDTYIEVIFYQGSAVINRTIDSFVLQNINLKDFKIQYYTGGAYADIPETIFTVNADASVRIKLSGSITTSKIKLLMKATITPAEEKKVGQFWSMLETYVITRPVATRAREDFTKGDTYRLGNGRLEQWSVYDKWQVVYNFNYLSTSEYNALYDIYTLHGSFVLYPDYELDIDEIKAVQWIGQWSGGDDQREFYHTVTMNAGEL